jgi:hypothetical protein
MVLAECVLVSLQARQRPYLHAPAQHSEWVTIKSSIKLLENRPLWDCKLVSNLVKSSAEISMNSPLTKLNKAGSISASESLETTEKCNGPS